MASTRIRQEEIYFTDFTNAKDKIFVSVEDCFSVNTHVYISKVGFALPVVKKG